MSAGGGSGRRKEKTRKFCPATFSTVPPEIADGDVGRSGWRPSAYFMRFDKPSWLAEASTLLDLQPMSPVHTTSVPQIAPPGAAHAPVRVTKRNTTTTDESGTLTLAGGVVADNFVLAAPSASPIRLISFAINRTMS